MALYGIQLYANIKRVLTKNFFMFIMHRITIQSYIKYNLSLVPLYSMSLFPWEGSRRNSLVAKLWSSDLQFGDIDKKSI
jgi:hypothetical protein